VSALAAGLDAAVYPVELADEPSLAAAFEALGRAGPLDFLVHCLVEIPDGVLERSILEVTRADFEHVMSVSAWSLIAACRHSRALLERSTAPRVVALTSACSHRMTPHYHVAGIAKAALESAVIYLAMQLGRDGILVNAVGASLIPTDGAVRAIGLANTAATRAVQARRSATGRAIEPGEVASCVGFLCSPLARNLTGEIFTVDGGFSRAYL
jgi:enoyl-[acyl-carrier protein] reductase I